MFIVLWLGLLPVIKNKELTLIYGLKKGLSLIMVDNQNKLKKILFLIKIYYKIESIINFVFLSLSKRPRFINQLFQPITLLRLCQATIVLIISLETISPV